MLITCSTCIGELFNGHESTFAFFLSTLQLRYLHTARIEPSPGYMRLLRHFCFHPGRPCAYRVLVTSWFKQLTAVFITIGPSGTFYTHRRTFGSHPGDGSEWLRFGAHCRFLSSPSSDTADARTSLLVCVKCGRGAYRYENSCKTVCSCSLPATLAPTCDWSRTGLVPE